MNDKVKVTILHSGTTIVDASTIFEQERKPLFPKLAMLGLFRGKKHKLEIPVAAYLIESKGRKVLIDTGFHKAVRQAPVKELTLIHYLVNKPVQSEGESVDEKLAALGIRPEDLDYVVLTHMHTDHAGGVRQFKKAKKIIVSERELRYAQSNRLEYVHKMWEGVNLETYQFSPSNHGPDGLSYDLFGDDSIVLVFVPGHTPGLAATLIQNNGKFLLLTSDCGYARRSWEKMILPGVMSDRENTIRSFEWVRNMSMKDNCIDCLATHETELESMVVEF
ncbi:TPA: N-acyl homoserine lactonase family protein [Pseudomonas aeruginosa]|uniref:N-acyl homoserine lactonase family protein n=1 Tax=Pseudomonas aeruginosa TaxID=287 RepID=UPI003981E5B7|nr:N-acyl homoserine lactonase family protein [Pseudomonas aeruginosa]